jgi:hypothetical protein
MELIERATTSGSTVTFRPARELRSFVPDDLVFSYDEAVDLSSLPQQVVELPFVWNVVPIVWAIGGHAQVDVLDPRVAASFSAVRNELRQMYPSLAWSGEVEARSLASAPPTRKPTHSTGVFFTGGVDSTYTALNYADQKPLLISIWGADIKLTDRRTWSNIERRNRGFARQYATDMAVARSNFRSINYPLLNRLSPDIRLWLSHVQVSMALASASAPIAYLAGAETLHMASSVIPESIDTVTYYAGLPRLDNLISLGAAQLHHDAPEVSRQHKVQYIVDYVRTNNAPPPFLQVCLHNIPRGGGNCQRCEKCLRTMLSLVVSGADPRLYGFPDYDDEHLRLIRDTFERGAIHFSQNEAVFWTDLQAHVPSASSADGEFWDWLRAVDFADYGRLHPPVRRRGWQATSSVFARAPRVLSAARRVRRGARRLDPRI